MSTFGTAIRSARKHMGWDRRSLASALRMSDKTIADLETRGTPQLPAALDILDLMDAYGFKFTKNNSAIEKYPELHERYFLTLDFRFDKDPDARVQAISRRMQVVGMSIVRRFNRAKMTASSFDGVELHVPPINKTAFEDVLVECINNFKAPMDCLVRNRKGIRMTKDLVPSFWDQD